MSVFLQAILKIIEANPAKVLDIISTILDLVKAHPDLTKPLLEAVIKQANQGTNA